MWSVGLLYMGVPLHIKGQSHPAELFVAAEGQYTEVELAGYLDTVSEVAERHDIEDAHAADSDMVVEHLHTVVAFAGSPGIAAVPAGEQ